MTGLATTSVFLVGLALVAIGVAAYSLPAGLITAGAILTLGAALYERGSRPDPPNDGDTR